VVSLPTAANVTAQVALVSAAASGLALKDAERTNGGWAGCWQSSSAGHHDLQDRHSVQLAADIRQPFGRRAGQQVTQAFIDLFIDRVPQRDHRVERGHMPSPQVEALRDALDGIRQKRPCEDTCNLDLGRRVEVEVMRDSEEQDHGQGFEENGQRGWALPRLLRRAAGGEIWFQSLLRVRHGRRR
jgi:hypothetical protein